MKKQMRKWMIPCAAALFTLGASMTSFAAQGWNMEGDTWVYLDSSGSRVTDTWKKSGDNWFYLNGDGEMAYSSVIEYDNDYYYVNSAGAMVSNEWREITADSDEEDAPETYWYYFQNNGKAYKAASSGKTTFKNIRKANGEWKKYAFDSEGRMLFGWVNEESERQTGDDAWKQGVYYCGDSSDGAAVTNAWSLQEVDDTESDDPYFNGSYWFYFGSNSKKITDATKTINGRKYRFDENGAAEYKWYEKASDNTASNSHLYYNLPEQAWLAQGWFKTVPGPTVDQEAYEDDTEYWFYAQTNGELVRSQLKTINNQRYAFNEKGEMLHGLYKLTFDENKKIETYEKIETFQDMPDENDSSLVYNFGDSPKEGAMSTGKTTIDIDGEKYSFNFRKSGSDKGAGYDGIYEDCIYIKGRMLKAEKDEKYKVVEYKGEDYLVSTSGKLAKSKKNLRDADGIYYSTSSKGIVTYTGDEKEK